MRAAGSRFGVLAVAVRVVVRIRDEQYAAPGGGTERFFEAAYEDQVGNFHREQEAITAGGFHSAGGVLSYLVSARKP